MNSAPSGVEDIDIGDPPQFAGTQWREHVEMLPHADHSDWLHLRWLYPAFYSATIVALGVALASRLLT